MQEFNRYQDLKQEAEWLEKYKAIFLKIRIISSAWPRGAGLSGVAHALLIPAGAAFEKPVKGFFAYRQF